MPVSIDLLLLFDPSAACGARTQLARLSRGASAFAAGDDDVLDFSEQLDARRPMLRMADNGAAITLLLGDRIAIEAAAGDWLLSRGPARARSADRAAHLPYWHDSYRTNHDDR